MWFRKKTKVDIVYSLLEQRKQLMNLFINSCGWSPLSFERVKRISEEISHFDNTYKKIIKKVIEDEDLDEMD